MSRDTREPLADVIEREAEFYVPSNGHTQINRRQWRELCERIAAVVVEAQPNYEQVGWWSPCCASPYLYSSEFTMSRCTCRNAPRRERVFVRVTVESPEGET